MNFLKSQKIALIPSGTNQNRGRLRYSRQVFLFNLQIQRFETIPVLCFRYLELECSFKIR